MSASVSSSISSSESALNYACSNNNSPKILQKSPSKNIQKYHHPKNIAAPAPTPSNTIMENNNEQPQIDLKKDSPQNIQLEKTGSTSADDRKSAVCLLPVKPEADFPHSPASDPTPPPDPFPPPSFSLEEGSPPSYFEDF